MKKKKVVSDKNAKMKSDKLNPFEVHINRSKHTILGQKSKDDRGLPGISRGKAYKKRENTLLEEYRDRHKDSKFVDLRIGEKSKNLDPEKKMMMRLAAEKKKQLSKKSIYNLNEEEFLTHDGRALTEDVMKDQKTFSDDDDEDELLGASFVKSKHFGGGLFTKSSSEVTDGEGRIKSRKEWIDDIIAESKKKKAESKQMKEEQNEAVTKLDERYQDFLYLMKGRKLTDEDKEKSKRNCEFRDYDLVVNAITFDRSKRAKPTDRLKTEEQMAKEEQERLRKLEDDRLRRMRNEDSLGGSSLPSMSADALSDGISMMPMNQLRISESHTLQKPESSKTKYKGKMEANENSEEEADSDEEESDEEDEDDDEEEEDHEVEDEGIVCEKAAGSVENEDEESCDEEDSDDESDNYSDVFEESEDCEDEAVSLENRTNPQKKVSGKQSESQVDELPFTFEVPGDYDDFWELLRGRTPAEVSTIVERMMACNHPSLAEDNKHKTISIFAYILQTLHSICSTDPEELHDDFHAFSYVDSFIPHMYTITQQSSLDSASSFSQVIDEKYEEYSSCRKRKYPFADTFVFLKIAGLLYPASDYRHNVMTRVLTFLTQLLGEARVDCGRDVVAAYFTASLLFEYLNRSKRFVGELMNTLLGLVSISLPQTAEKGRLSHFTPFKRIGPSSTLLLVNEPQEYSESKLTLTLLNEEDLEMNYSLKVAILNGSLRMMSKLRRNWSNLPALRSIFLPVSQFIDLIPAENYPEQTKSLIQELQNDVRNLPAQAPHLKKMEEQVRTLKMMEPTFEKIIDGVKKRGGNREFQEKQKLIHKLKRERKGAKRELKRDAEFLARQRLKEDLESDAERKRKVNLIMRDLATQEHEFKKLKFSK